MEIECFISVDVETSGPVPGVYSLLSIGACSVENHEEVFEIQLKPTSGRFDPKALEVSGFSLEKLVKDGTPPAEAMARFATWVERVSFKRTPVFVGLNAGFDWSFINYYFHCYIGKNPFGFAPLDIKALYMGVTGTTWLRSKSSVMATTLGAMGAGDHNALRDACFQGELFRLIMERRRQQSSSGA